MDFTNNKMQLTDHFLDINSEVGDIFQIDPQLDRRMGQSIDMTVNAVGRAVSGNLHLSMTRNIQAGLTGEQTKYIVGTSQDATNTSSSSHGIGSSSRNAVGRSLLRHTAHDHLASTRRRISAGDVHGSVTQKRDVPQRGYELRHRSLNPQWS